MKVIAGSPLSSLSVVKLEDIVKIAKPSRLVPAMRYVS